MVFNTRWIFRCLGCKSKEKDDTEYIDLAKIKNVDDMLHIKDIVVSKPELYLESPKSIFISKQTKSYEDRRFGTIKPPIAIPIKSKWPSDISSDDEELNESQRVESNDKSNKLVVPLSNISGFLEEDFENKQLTISQSIAIAEKIYQNEKRQIMNSGKFEDKSTEKTNYVESESLFREKINTNYQIIDKSQMEFSFSMGDSVESTISFSENGPSKSLKEELNNICYMSDYDEDEESLTSKVWNMFVSASKVLRNNEENKLLSPTNQNIIYETKRERDIDQGEINLKGCNNDERVRQNYKLTSREALEIVEGAIKKINENVL